MRSCSIFILTVILLNGNWATALNVSSDVLQDLQTSSSDPERVHRISQYLKTHAAEAGVLAERIASKPSSTLQFKESIYSLPFEERLEALSSILEQCEQGTLEKEVAFDYFNPSVGEGFGYSEGAWQLASYFRDPEVRKLYQRALSVLGERKYVKDVLEEILSGKYRVSMLRNCFYFPDQYQRIPPRLGGRDTWDVVKPVRSWSEQEQQQAIKNYFLEWRGVLNVIQGILDGKARREEGLERLNVLEKKMKSSLEDLQDLRSPRDMAAQARLVTFFRDDLVSSFVCWKRGKGNAELGKLDPELDAVLQSMGVLYQVPDCYLSEEMMRKKGWNEEFSRKGKALLKEAEKQDRDE